MLFDGASLASVHNSTMQNKRQIKYPPDLSIATSPLILFGRQDPEDRSAWRLLDA